MKTAIKRYFDRIGNEKFKLTLLQAFPFWIASVITGVVAVLYTKLFSFAEKGAAYFLQLRHCELFILTPCCFLLAVWLVRRVAPYSGGSGIPQVMAAIELSTPKEITLADRLLNLKTIAVKIISSCLMALGGGIVGREGPTIQIAGSIFRRINGWLPSWWPKISKQNMIMTGAAAGLAAAFNTPLGGIVFAIEELTKTHIRFYKTAIFTAVIIAGLTAQGMLGPYLYIGYPVLSNLHFWIFLPVMLTALVCGIGAALLSRGMLALTRWRKSFDSSWRLYVYVLFCGLAIAAIALLTGDQGIHSGKEVITGVLFTGDKYLPWYTPFVRAIGSALSFTTGAAGGVFAPALSTGIAFGSTIAHWFSLTAGDTNLVALAGMVAFLTGVTRSPFTSAILVLEMTDGHSVIFYLMLAGILSNLAAHLVDKHSLYEHMKKNLLQNVRKPA